MPAHLVGLTRVSTKDHMHVVANPTCFRCEDCDARDNTNRNVLYISVGSEMFEGCIILEVSQVSRDNTIYKHSISILFGDADPTTI